MTSPGAHILEERERLESRVLELEEAYAVLLTEFSRASLQRDRLRVIVDVVLNMAPIVIEDIDAVHPSTVHTDDIVEAPAKEESPD